MTVIIGLVHEERVWMGADRRGSWSEGSYYARGISKIWRFGHGLLVGFAGNCALTGAMRAWQGWDRIVPERFDECWWAETPNLLNWLDLYKLDERKDDGSGDLKVQGMMLVGTGIGQLYEIDVGLAVARIGKGVEAIGSGGEAALGSLLNDIQCLRVEQQGAEKTILRALRVAAMVRSNCGPPYDVVDVDGTVIQYEI